MAESVNLLKRVKSIQSSPELAGYSGVVIYAGQDENGDNIEYRAGNDSGTVLEITNEWGSQEQANAIYDKIRAFNYRPYRASGARIDPSVEIGDAVTLDGLYSGIFRKSTVYGRHISTELEAPYKDEIEHEFRIQSPTSRQYARFSRSVKANLSLTASQILAEVEARTQQGVELLSAININAENITAKVSKQSTNESSTFGWNLTSDEWKVFSGSKENAILRATKEGLEVKGVIKADEGYIGGEDGFVITASAIYNNIPSFGSTQNHGVYIGTDGIRLGSGFWVDSAGNLTAKSGKFGSLSVNSSGNTVGTYGGSLSGCGGSVSGLSGSLSTGISIGREKIATYVENLVADTVTATYIDAQTAELSEIRINWERFSPGNIFYVNRNGTISRARVLMTQDN